MGLGEYLDLDLTIVRGLAYYTGTVFELFDARGELRAICGGGRYDNLLQSLGGVDLPALGFGMGDVVLGELLRDRGLVPEAGLEHRRLPGGDHRGRPAARARRSPRSCGTPGSGWSTRSPPQAVGKQLKLADARSARLAVVVGPDDRARGEVMLKDLRGRTQESVQRAVTRADRRRVGAGTRGARVASGTSSRQC